MGVIVGNVGLDSRAAAWRQPSHPVPRLCSDGRFSWIWVPLMAVVAASLFWIHQIRMFGPDPSLVDLHAPDSTARGVAGTHPSRRRSAAVDDHVVFRRAGDRGGCSRCCRHASARIMPHVIFRLRRGSRHARSGLPKRGFAEAVSRWKNKRKKRLSQAFRGWLSDPRCAI
jgi:hypothetical protein